MTEISSGERAIKYSPASRATGSRGEVAGHLRQVHRSTPCSLQVWRKSEISAAPRPSFHEQGSRRKMAQSIGFTFPCITLVSL